MFTQAQFDAAIGEVIPQSYTDINDRNLTVPIDAAIWRSCWGRDRRRSVLARRALLAMHYEICRSGLLLGSVPAPLVADWIWGPGAKPRHWRSAMNQAFEEVEAWTQCQDGTQSVTL